MTLGSYHQFCPVAMASEVLCTRWTMVLLRELVIGSTRFNDLRRGLPRMSPALLSQRLKELEAAGIVERRRSAGAASPFEYVLTEAGRDLKPVVEAVGQWGQRWVSADLSLQRLDVSLLVWDMRRNLDPEPFPQRAGGGRWVIQFSFTDQPASRRSWWLLVESDGAVDLCAVDPGFDVDLYVAADLRTMTAIWMGLDKVAAAVADRRLLLTGERRLADSMQAWLGLSPFAGVQKRAS
jgi:DNA-binding HxlR family transcriptional regulator